MIPAVMISHESRALTHRVESLTQLASAGIHPTVIESTYNGREASAEVRRLGYEALKHGTDKGLLFFEDDIIVDPDLLPWHVERARRAELLAALCAVNERHYKPSILRDIQNGVRLHPHFARIPKYDDDKGFHGSMAVYIPRQLVVYGLARQTEFQQPDGSPLEHPVIPPDYQRGKVTGFDFWLKHAARIAPLKYRGMFAAIPNSVNHVGSADGAWRSPTFGAPYYEPGEL